MKPDEWGKRYPNFTMQEVYSKEAYERLQATNYRAHKISFEHMDLLQALRTGVNKKFTINKPGSRRRGVRTPLDSYTLYKEQGINPFFHSYHVMGLATDVTCEGLDTEEFFEIAIDFQHGGRRFTGFGLYNTFLHLDSRPWHGNGYAYWDKRTQ